MLSHQNINTNDALKLAQEQMLLGNHLVAKDILLKIKDITNDAQDIKYMLAIVNYNLGDIKEAVRILQNIVNSNNQIGADIWCNLACFLAELKNYDKANDAFDQAIAIDKNYPDSYWNKTNLLCLMGLYEDAQKYGLKATKLTPNREEAWLNLGVAEAKLNNFQKAILAWEQALKINPYNSIALSNLGNIWREAGDLDKAKKYCEDALKLDGNNAQAMNNLGNILFDLGQLNDAVDWYKKAITKSPNYAEAHNNLAVSLMQLQNFTDAIIEAKYACLFDENYSDAYMNLAIALKSIGNIQEAEQALSKAISIENNNPIIEIEYIDMLFTLGRISDAELLLSRIKSQNFTKAQEYIKFATILEKMGKFKDAITIANKAIELNPKLPESYIKKGQIYHMYGNADEAEKCYNKAAQINPNNLSLLTAMADLQQSKGNKEKSEKLARKAKAIKDDLPGIYGLISKVKKFTSIDDKDLKDMLKIAKNVEDKGFEAAATLHFAIFSAFDNLQEYKLASKHLKLANEYKRKLVPDIKVQPHFNIIDNLKLEYPVEKFSELQNLGYMSNIPVFIVGMPRSGTSLTEQILAAHPDIYGAGEILDFGQAEQAFGEVINSNNCYKIGKYYTDNIKKYDKSQTALRIVNKMPGNFMRIGQILSSLPNAKIIHCRRNAHDTSFSCYKQNFAKGHEWAYDLNEIAKYYKSYEEVMAYWQKTLPPNSFLEILYEDLVYDLEKNAKKLIKYLGLRWKSSCLKPHLYKRDVFTASKNQVREPIYTSSVNAWQKYSPYLTELQNIL